MCREFRHRLKKIGVQTYFGNIPLKKTFKTFQTSARFVSLLPPPTSGFVYGMTGCYQIQPRQFVYDRQKFQQNGGMQVHHASVQKASAFSAAFSYDGLLQL